MSEPPPREGQRWQAVTLNGDHSYNFEAGVTAERGCTIVSPAGELDIATCEALERRIAPLLEQGEHVIVDLCGLLFVDVAGMRALLSCARLAQARGVRFSIALGSERVRRLFELCRMLDEFDFVYESLAAVPR